VASIKAKTNSRRRPEQPPTPLTEQAYLAIKAEILANRLSPGAPLPIERFIREMNLSRTPVREAILKLQREGFVEVLPRLGTFVAQLDLRKIKEMYHVRAVLEGSAAKLAAPRLHPETLARLEEKLSALKVKGRNIQLQEISEAGQELHRTIIDGCDNQLLATTIRGLQDHFQRFRHVSLQFPEKVLSSHQEHLAILSALRARNGDKAEKLVREHFEHASRFLVESLLNSPNWSYPLRVAAASGQ
jgi:DNA-binding GntR family transcriptional regulator